MKIDLGCANFKKEGFIGIDCRDYNCVDGTKFVPDIMCDLNCGIPLMNDYVEEIYCSHLLEHIKNPYKLLEEMFIVCKNQAIIEIIVPLFDVNHDEHKTCFYDRWFENCLNLNNFEIIKKSINREKPVIDPINGDRILQELKIILKVKK